MYLRWIVSQRFGTNDSKRPYNARYLCEWNARHSVTSAALSVRTPVDIHELYKWYMLNWSITISHVSRFPNQNIKSPMMWRRVANHKNFDGAVSGGFPSHTVYTKNDLFWPVAGAQKWGYFDTKYYGGLLEKNSPPRMVGGSGGQILVLITPDSRISC